MGRAPRPLALLPLPPRSRCGCPFAFGVATLWLAWRLGWRLADHPLGGLLALAVVAVDPVSVVWSQQLKPYTAEAAMALLPLLAADRVARRARTADVVRLALVLTLGTALSNVQLLVAPPILAALAGHAAVRGDRPTVRRIVLAGVVVAPWDVAWFASFMRSWLQPMQGYWSSHAAPLAHPAALLAFTHQSFALLLGPGLGVDGSWLALGGLVALLAWPGARWAGLALLLLAAELIVLSVTGSFPLDVQRTGLFVSTVFQVTTAAAAGALAARLWSSRPLRPVAIALLLLFAFAILRDHEWPPYEQVRAEELSLVQRMERERQAGDHILLYQAASSSGVLSGAHPTLERRALAGLFMVGWRIGRHAAAFRRRRRGDRPRVHRGPARLVPRLPLPPGRRGADPLAARPRARIVREDRRRPLLLLEPR